MTNPDLFRCTISLADRVYYDKNYFFPCMLSICGANVCVLLLVVSFAHYTIGIFHFLVMSVIPCLLVCVFSLGIAAAGNISLFVCIVVCMYVRICIYVYMRIRYLSCVHSRSILNMYQPFAFRQFRSLLIELLIHSKKFSSWVI